MKKMELLMQIKDFEVFNFSDLIDYRNNVKNISSLFLESKKEHISENLTESQWFKQFFQKMILFIN